MDTIHECVKLVGLYGWKPQHLDGRVDHLYYKAVIPLETTS